MVVFKVLVSLFGFPDVKSVVILFLLSLWGILFDATGEGPFLSTWLQSKPVKYNSAHMWLTCAGGRLGDCLCCGKLCKSDL